jgi:O-glycosyl hydrolase
MMRRQSDRKDRKVRRLSLVGSTVLIGFLPILLILPFILRGPDGIDVMVNGNVGYQRIDGWGIAHYIEWKWEGPQRYPIPEKDVMNQIKYDLGIDYVQVRDHTFNFFMEEINDDADPFHFNWASYNDQFGRHAITFQRLKEMQDLGLKFIPGPFALPAWISDAKGSFDPSKPNAYEELGESWAAFCIYAKENFGLAIPYIILQIEPDMPNHQWTSAELRQGIKVVGNRLRKEGFDTMIVAPDTGAAASALEMSRAILPDSLAKSYMNCVAYHPYDNGSGRDGPDNAISAISNLAADSSVRSSGLPLWMTEWTMAWAYGDRLRNWVDTLRVALDFAKMVYNTHVFGNASLYVVWTSKYDWGYDVDGNGILENEGIFGPGVTQGKLNLKKYGQALSQFTKYIPPGSRRIAATVSGGSSLYVTAYEHSHPGNLTIVAINKGTSPQFINVKLTNVDGVGLLDVIRTSAGENLADLGEVALDQDSFGYLLPGESVTTFTGETEKPVREKRMRRGKIPHDSPPE